MKKEDREWLESALKQYTYNDTDRLKEIVTFLQEKREAGGEQTSEANDELEALIEELQDLVELHPRNNLNLCLSGGMHELLSLALAHPSQGVRRSVCFLISSVCSNNKQVQEFASKGGALNLLQRFGKEKNMRNKEAVFGALSSFIKSENFHGKRQFIEEYNGLEFLASLMNDETASASLRLYKKVLNLALDLVVNDDGIFKENPFLVREYFSQSEAIMN